MFTLVTLLAGSYLLFYSLHGLILIIFSGSSFEKKTANVQKTDPKEWLFVLPAYKPDTQLIEGLRSIQKHTSNKPYNVIILFQEANQKLVEKICIAQR